MTEQTPSTSELTDNQRALIEVKELMQQMEHVPTHPESPRLQERQKTFTGGETMRITIKSKETSNLGLNEECAITVNIPGPETPIANIAFQSIHRSALDRATFRLSSVSVGEKDTGEVYIDLLTLPLIDTTDVSQPAANPITTVDVINWFRSNVTSPSYVPFPPITFQPYQGS